MTDSRALALSWILLASVSPLVTAAETGRELRVCGDPDNLPFSNNQMEGFENKIARVVASDLNATLKYTWSPQGRNFIRQTLNAEKCDLVIGAPAEWGAVLTTQPYYTSTYVFVYPKNKHRKFSSFDDPALREEKIGLPLISSDGTNPPPAYALARRGLAGNVVGYSIFPPSGIIDGVAAGEVGVAIVWGPFGGYYAKHQTVELAVTPVTPSDADSSLRFTFDISMGVRRGNTALKEELEGVLKRRQKEIAAVLDEYGIPVVASTTAATSESAKSISLNTKGDKEK